MEHLFERLHGAIGQGASRLDKKAGHFFLPTFVDLTTSHASPSSFEVFCLEVSDQQSVWTQEQGVVVPSRFAQGCQHLGPYAAVAGLVFVEPIGSHLQNEADALHLVSPKPVKAPQQEEGLSRNRLLPQKGLRQTAVHGNHMPCRLGAVIAGQPDDRAGTVARKNGALSDGTLRVEISQFRT